MRRLLLIGTIVLILLAAAVLLAVRSVLDPETIRVAAETRLSTMLGQPVSIGSMHVSVLPIPAVAGSAIRIGLEREAPELSLQRVRIVPRVRSLFRGPYVIREVTLEGLTARVERHPPGRWKFPSAVPAPGGGSGGQIVIERVRLIHGRVRVFQFSSNGRVHETAGVEDIEGEAVADAAGLRIAPIRGRIGQAPIAGEAMLDPQAARIDFSLPDIKHGDVPAVLGLSGADPPESLALQRPATASMSIRIDRKTLRMNGSGSVRVPEMSVHSVRLQNLEAPIKTDGEAIALDPMTFALYGGTYRGSLTIDVAKTTARWSAGGRTAGVDVSRFLRDFTGNERLAGTASTTTALRGAVGDPIPAGLQGRLQLDVVNGVVRGFPLLAAINRAVRLAEGDSRDTRFERLTGTFVFGDSQASSDGAVPGSGYAATNDLILQASQVRVAVAGRIGFDRSLDLAGDAILSPERTASAIRSVRELSGLRNAQGELELPLKITGTLDNPSFSIDLKAVVGRSLKEELRRRLRNIFRRVPAP